MKRLYHAFLYSINGLKLAIRDEAAFRTLVILFVVGVTAALMLPLTTPMRMMIIAAHGLTLVVELLNTAIEAIVDRISEERHPLSGKAKDCGSAAQFLMLFLLAGAWLVGLVGLV